MGWRLPRLRLRLSTLIVLVAVCGLATWFALPVLSPTWRIARLIRPGQPTYQRWEHASALGYVPSWEAEGAIDLLIGTLADPSPRVRQNALTGLFVHELRAARAIPAMLKLLNDPDRRVRYSACAALAAVTPPDEDGPRREEVVAGLMRILDDSDPDNRLIAAVSLLRLREIATAVPLLARAATDPDEEHIRSHARHFMNRYGRKADLVAGLLPLVRSKEPARRQIALEFLVEIAPPETLLAALRDAVDDDDPDIRRWAAEKLEELSPDADSPTAP